MVATENLQNIDKWALIRLSKLTEKVLDAYRNYEFHIVQHAIHNFCIVDMSNFYLDVIKDRLYAESTDGEARRAAQTVMYKVLDALVKLLAPVLAFTSEEIWASMPHTASDKKEYVILNDMPKPTPELYDDVFESKWDRLMLAKADVSKALEEARAAKVIGKSLGAKVEIFAEGSYYELLKEMEDDLFTYFITSGAKVSPIEEAPENAVVGETGIKVLVALADGDECERCWIHSETVGKDSDHPTLCARCASVLKEGK
jgi:isoleucyl-tRNA synthetase